MSTKTIPLALVAAVARNGVIGGDNTLLWRLSSDLKRFKAITMGKPLLMGRKTFDSIGKPLPGRETIVVTRDRSFAVEGVHVAHDPQAGLALARGRAAAMGADEVILAGGAELYALLLPQVTRMYLTHVELTPEGDAHFPDIDWADWHEVARVTPVRQPKDEADFNFVDYVRVISG